MSSFHAPPGSCRNTVSALKEGSLNGPLYEALVEHLGFKMRAHLPFDFHWTNTINFARNNFGIVHFDGTPTILQCSRKWMAGIWRKLHCQSLWQTCYTLQTFLGAPGFVGNLQKIGSHRSVLYLPLEPDLPPIGVFRFFGSYQLATLIVLMEKKQQRKKGLWKKPVPNLTARVRV